MKKKTSQPVLALLQARMSSTRLPGKVMKPILGKPLLELQIERVRRCRKIDILVVVTSTEKSDDAIEALCRRMAVACFRGDLTNVLDRYYQASQQYDADTIVRLTGDCTLTDPEKIDELITFFQSNEYDYVNNSKPPCLPHGLDAEVFSRSTLEQTWKHAGLPSEKEHVTPYMYKPENGFSIGHLNYPPSHVHLRWCVDEPEDYVLVKKIYEALYPSNPQFSSADIIRLMSQKPALIKINAGFARNEGYLKSLEEDRS